MCYHRLWARYGGQPRSARWSYRKANEAFARGARLSHEDGGVLERGVAKAGPLALDDGGRQHGNDVRGEPGDAARDPEEHARGTLVVTPLHHLLDLRWVESLDECQRAGGAGSEQASEGLTSKAASLPEVPSREKNKTKQDGE